MSVSAETGAPAVAPTRRANECPHCEHLGSCISATPSQACGCPHHDVRRRMVEQDVADILHDAWAAAPDAEPINLDHDAVAAQVMDAADVQDADALRAALQLVQSSYDETTLGDIADRVLIYTVQKGWSGACKVRARPPQRHSALPCYNVTLTCARSTCACSVHAPAVQHLSVMQNWLTAHAAPYGRRVSLRRCGAALHRVQRGHQRARR